MAILLSTLVFTRPRTAAVGTLSRAAAGGLRGRRHALAALRSPAVRMQHGSAVDERPDRTGQAPELVTGMASAEGLQLLNSLTQTVEPFTPIDSRLVKWYVWWCS